MGQITKITKETDNRFVNLYCFDTIKKTGKAGRYFVASRAAAEKELEARTHENKPDGVTMMMLYGQEKEADRLVLIRQYRFTIDGYLYELPAGLVEENEDYRRAACREAKEETGLELKLLNPDPSYEKPFYLSVGMTDESIAMVYGYASGDIRNQQLESGEEIDVVLADKKEAMRILKEERVAMPAALSIMHFVADEEPFGFLKGVGGR